MEDHMNDVMIYKVIYLGDGLYAQWGDYCIPLTIKKPDVDKIFIDVNEFLKSIERIKNESSPLS